jgi:hypothetical protein
MVTVNVSLRSRYPEYLRFPDNPDAVIDLGQVPIDPNAKYSRVAPFVVENVCEEPLLLQVKSNLATQLFVFVDENLKEPPEELRLPPKSSHTLQVALAPSLKGELNKTNARELVGGLRIKVMNLHKAVVFEKTAKFVAIVGRSEFSVSPQHIDLGMLLLAQQTPHLLALRQVPLAFAARSSPASSPSPISAAFCLCTGASIPPARSS